MEESESAHEVFEPEQERKVGQYLMGKTIGQGTFNKVRIARHIHTNEQVAVKLIDKDSIKNETDNMRLSREMKILRKARHPNIIQLYEILEDGHYYYLVTEYASRGQLFGHIVKNQKLTEFEASKFLQQLMNAIEYLHELGVVHRDLKPENLLLDYKYNVKLVDFGLSNIFSKGQTLKSACGSPCYACPQMLSSKGYDPIKADIWSIGIVLYAMCFGYLPFDHPEQHQLFKIIRKGQYEVPEHASEELRSLLGLILEVDPQKRVTIDEIRHHKFCLNNPVPTVFGIIQGLSSIPFEQKVQKTMAQLRLDTISLYKDIHNNKHNDNTATYYLLLQKDLRQNNQTILNYYVNKDNIINRYRLVQKVKVNYEKRLQERIQMLQRSRKMKANTTATKKKRSKTTDKKYHTGIDSNSKPVSKNLFNSPPKKRRTKSKEAASSTKDRRKSKKKLKRTDMQFS